jgi:hypothetical protein
MRSSNGSLVVQSNGKVKIDFALSPSCSFIVYKNKLHSQVYFFNVYYHKTCRDPPLSGGNVVPTSDVRTTFILILLTVGS